MSAETRTTRWAPDTDPLWRPCLRRPPGQDHRKHMILLHNLTLLQPGIELLVSSGQRRTGPRLSLVSPKVFSPFCHRWSFGSLPQSPLACLVGNTYYPAISLTWLHRYYLNWTELDDDITEFNEELPLTEKLVFTIVILHYWHTIFLINVVQLLWHNLYC